MYATKLTPEQTAGYADQFEAHGGTLCHGQPGYIWWHGAYSLKADGSTDWDSKASGEYDRLIAAGTITYGDGLAILREVHRRQIQRKIEAFETSPAIHAHMMAAILRGDRDVKAPEKADMSFFTKAAQSTRTQYGSDRKPYAPQHPCSLRLKLSEAVRFTSSQEAYADYYTTLVPVLGDVATANLEHCQTNLSAMVRYADTHTGWAGSGCNYTASLVTNEHGAFAVITCAGPGPAKAGPFFMA